MITITVKNIDQVQAAFKKAPQKIATGLSLAIGRIITRIDADAKRESPVNKQSGGGNLRQSIRSYMQGKYRGIVEVGAQYAIYVHEGTRPHVIRYSKPGRGGLYDKRTKRGFGRVVQHPGTKANPFLQRAVDKNESFIDQEFNKVVDNLI